MKYLLFYNIGICFSEFVYIIIIDCLNKQGACEDAVPFFTSAFEYASTNEDKYGIFKNMAECYYRIV